MKLCFLVLPKLLAQIDPLLNHKLVSLQFLKKAIEKYGTKWSAVAQMVPCRTSTQCRERWVNVLDTSINRNKWEKEEDERLISICKQYEGEEEILFLIELSF